MTILDARESAPSEGGPSFSLSNRLIRAAWIVVWALGASWTPRQLAGWRRLLLRLFGARMAPGSDVRGSARVWYPPHLEMHARALVGPGVNVYSMGQIVVGEDALVSQGAHLCAGTHDYNSPEFQLQARPIVIGARAWIAAEAFVGPGARVGEGAVLGARAVVFGELEPWTVYSGNPAMAIRKRRRHGAATGHSLSS
ncbi:putative colanic acid biosynthesis acetyltransferase [Variovorax sp. J22R133]|uniref:putative colanic acid biosynthesis acetyltransferase n=1 Tax=Variovorax brevis TaxID=3053503 RepID=UPI002575D26A|nr:putative colanic acid biosynthesis acetyltransferase [Variovorax sp. J22R133]MDM0114269.1 putative colanic acid biosynthesis acetyltransferase [Variovorax sp. J22R133]